MTMALGAVAFSGCDEKEPEPTPVLQSFEVNVDEVTRTAVTYTVTPTLTDKEYIALVMTAESVQGADDEAVVAKVMDEVQNQASHSGKTFQEQMSALALKGVSSKKTVSGLALDTKYALIVFGVDPEDSWKNTTFPVVKEFTTQKVEMVNCTFDVTATVDKNTVEFNVVPSDKNVRWHLMVVMKEMYDSYTSPDGDYQWTEAQFYQAYTENEIQQYAGAGMTEEEILQTMFVQGDQTLNAKGLNTNTEYMYLVAGFDIDGSNMYLVTDVADGTFLTENVAKSDMTFEISVTDVEQMSAAVLITPSSDTETFCWMCQQYDGVSTAEEVMNSIVTANKMWFDMGIMLYSGVQDYTGGPGSPYKYPLDKAGTDYCVIAFGYAGGVTTDPVMVTFTTLPGGSAEDCTFEAEVLEVGTYEASFEVRPSDISIYYSAGVCLASEYNEEALKAEAEMGIQQMVQMQQMFDPSATVGSVLAMYYWNGTYTIDANDLAPDTEYMMFILAFNQDTGEVAAVHTFPAFFKTKPVSDIVPEIQILGYYSGDDEAGAVFGQPDVTAGKSIVVVKYNVENASALYSSIMTGNAMDYVTYPDADMMSQLKYYWTTMDLNQPYSFFVIKWLEENTVFSYALDADGSQGGLVRELLYATADVKKPIEDLITLVNELNSKEAKTVALPNTLNGEKAKPVVTARGWKPAEKAKPGNITNFDYVPGYWAN